MLSFQNQNLNTAQTKNIEKRRSVNCSVCMLILIHRNVKFQQNEY